MCVRWIFKLKLMCGPWGVLSSEQREPTPGGQRVDGDLNMHPPSAESCCFPRWVETMKCWHGEQGPPRWARDSQGGTECRQPGWSSGAGLRCPKCEADTDSWASPQDVWVPADMKPRELLHAGKLHSLQLYLFKKNLLYWSMVNLQVCINFGCTAKWLSYAQTFFLIFFPLWFITGYWLHFPVLYGRTLLFICSIYTSLHLLNPNSHSIPPPALQAPGNHKSVLCVCESVSVP